MIRTIEQLGGAAGAGRPALLGVADDSHSSFLRGAALGPARLREALLSPASNLWSESGIDLESLLVEAGDVEWPDGEDAGGAIETRVGELLDRGFAPLVLGGDHSITEAVLRGFEPRFPGLELLHLDAHPDLYDSFDDDPRSHASPFARIMERGRVRRLVQIGVRTMNGHQRAQAERFGVEVVEMRQLGDGWPALRFDGPLYVSLDLDVFDPGFAPGVSHHEPGGLGSRQVLDLLHRIEGRLVGADVVELNPTRDLGGITAALAAKLIKELAAGIVASHH